jgi:branched-chain amino acid transport system substrate-binding protein
MRLQVFTIVLAALAGPADAQAVQAAGPNVVIGDIDDLSGVYADGTGAGAIEAMKMAIADFGGVVLGRKIVTQIADHQNKPDIGAS